jgi:prolipoprotein diacylglyceryl transferase
LEIFAHIVWNGRPELFTWGPLTVRWYGVLFALAFSAGYFIARYQFRQEARNPEHLDSLLVWTVIGIILGARLAHVFFYEPAYYMAHPGQIIQVWRGGLASHGGFLGGITALYIYTRRHKDLGFVWLLDRAAVPAALGGALVRVGNFFNSEILGHPSEVPWAIVFAREDLLPRHPAQLYEAAAYMAVFALLFWVYRRLKDRTPGGLLIGLFLLLVFAARFLIEFVKERQAAYETGFPLSVGQWLSIPLIFFGAALAWRGFRKLTGTKELPHP